MKKPQKLKAATCGCGHQANLIELGADHYLRACSDCGMTGPAKKDKDEATLAWNIGVSGESEPA